MVRASDARRVELQERKALQPTLSQLFGSGDFKGQASWKWAVPADLAHAIERWTTRGGAITLGLTSDGGALSITLLEGGERYKFYAADEEQLAAHLAKIAQAS